jgi:hypothetical protein
MDFKTDVLNDIVLKKKVVLIGGSKSACDISLGISRSGYDNFVWVHRTPYLFWKYEWTFHDRSILITYRGVSTLAGLLWILASKTLAGWICCWGSGLATTYGKAHNDWDKFHFGILCSEQRPALGEIPSESMCIGDPIELTANGVMLDSGKVIEADTIIFATGCKSGVDNMYLQKDGEPYKIDHESALFNHFIYPDFPVLANSTALWTTFGPMRAFISADLAITTFVVCAAT